MVLDNARNAAQVRALLPGSATCAAVVTSRDSLDGLVSRDGAQVVRLGTLAADDALTVLADVAGASGLRDDPAAARLAALCDGLPLALRIAGARLAGRPDVTAADLAERFADERRRLDELTHGDLRLRTHFALSYRSLAPAEARLFRLLGLLDTTSFATWVGAALLDGDLATAHELIEQLVDAQLLEVDCASPTIRPLPLPRPGPPLRPRTRPGRGARRRTRRRPGPRLRRPAGPGGRGPHPRVRRRPRRPARRRAPLAAGSGDRRPAPGRSAGMAGDGAVVAGQSGGPHGAIIAWRGTWR